MATPPTPNPSKVLVVGDTHGNTEWWLDHVLPLALRFDVEGIVQVGDFGVWHGDKGSRYLDSLDKELELLDQWVLFIDGNHEDFDLLYSIPLREDGFREVRHRIIHAPRGQRWTWNGLTFLAMGGGASIDKSYRIEGESWWPQELITQSEVDRATTGGECDVMLTHDAPASVPFEGLSPHSESDQNRAALQQVIDAARPKLLLHGHLHHAYRHLIQEPAMLIVGLSCDGKNGNCVVLPVAAPIAPDTLSDQIVAADSGPGTIRKKDLSPRFLDSPRWQ